MTTALILVDIQNDYFPKGRMELRNPIEASKEAQKLLTYFRETNQPVFHIQHVSTKPNAAFFLPDTEGVLIHEHVHPLTDEAVIIKHYPNSFRETSLLEQLKEQNIERLIICGMMTHMCVDATTRAAFDYGFSCIVIHDACATRDLLFKTASIPAAYVHSTILASLNGTYAEVLGTDEYMLREQNAILSNQ
ncbi:cysteine hydrolase family protein [Ectobacillus panaciterrae]|uniref:cysteine hydrolase family protein n=1 Tax=Ectobacillus panaciterrae TaxID=363872 RepID=UPI0004017ACE|nr:cysteine hydrolase family protein [Ectobacillus panaciterrae]